MHFCRSASHYDPEFSKVLLFCDMSPIIGAVLSLQGSNYDALLLPERGTADFVL
jgi:hypothetical protein